MNIQQENQGTKYFGVLACCTLASLVLLSLSAAGVISPALALVGAMLPLLGYHLVYLRPRAATLSQAAIDSVYYYGFLVTIGALAASALQLSQGGKVDSMQAVGWQFALGLLATGYAVIARLHLTSAATLEVLTPEDALNKVLGRTGELADNIELASTRFSVLAKSLTEQSKEAIDGARRHAEEAMLSVAQRFDTQMTDALRSVQVGVSEVQALVKDASFLEERKQLLDGISATLSTVNALNKSMDELATRSAESAHATNSLSVAKTQLTESVSRLEQRFDGVASEQGAAHAVSKAVESVSELSARSSELMATTLKNLEELQPSLPSAVVTLKSIRQLTARANDQMEALVSSSSQLAGATADIERTAKAATSLFGGLDGIGNAVTKANEGIQGLGDAMSSYKHLLGQSASDARTAAADAISSIKGSTEDSAKAVTTFTDGLTRATQMLIDRTKAVPA